MKAIKPFTTRLRRFKPGDDVRRRDDLGPHTIESLQAAGYVQPPVHVEQAKPQASRKPASRRG